MLDPDFLAAIGHPARLRALILLEQEPASAREVAARAELPAGEAEEHLRHLAEAGLIDPVDAGDEAGGELRWRPRATGWAELADLLARAAGEPPPRAG